MRPGNGPEQRDQDDKDRARGYRIAHQRDSHVIAELVGHYAGADNRTDQEHGAKRFGSEAAGKIKSQARVALCLMEW